LVVEEEAAAMWWLRDVIAGIGLVVFVGSSFVVTSFLPSLAVFQ